jgi:hypothetical protein
MLNVMTFREELRARISEDKGLCAGVETLRALYGFAVVTLNVMLVTGFMAGTVQAGVVPSSQVRMAEWTVESKKIYRDPFNDVDVDVVFSKEGTSWRVPAFWRGGSRWTVRFAPPTPGEYEYRWQSTDKTNPDLNGHPGVVTIMPFTGTNVLFARGAPQVSADKRHFEYADGVPFFWLGDTWWSGLSDRLSWEGFQALTADRQKKGFTVIQIAAGLVPVPDNGKAPVDPGYCNEGGCVWDPEFHRINPQYFDFADRRIQYLLDHELVPAIVGGWRPFLAQMGVAKMKQHWRYVIARYGAYPVFWLGGGEAYDPPPANRRLLAPLEKQVLGDSPIAGSWTEVVRYIRDHDPYHRPLSIHEIDPPFDLPLQDESLTDFDLFQAGHRGWPSIATEIALLNKHYARTTIIKPLVLGEIGYEKMTGENDEGYQRAAFWLAMLNGAAGFTYGNISTAISYSVDKMQGVDSLSPYTSEEAMQFPGAAQVAAGAHLLRQYAWWKMAPHPDWVSPHGTTLLEPNTQVNAFDIDLIAALARQNPPHDDELPLGEWSDRHGKWRLPYAAGVPGTFRLIYMPYSWFRASPMPVVQALEPGVRYHAFYWEPTFGVQHDLGWLETGAKGSVDISHLHEKLYDAQGRYRGELHGLRGKSYGTHQRVEGDRYFPEPFPSAGDWLLVLETEEFSRRTLN